MRVGIGFDMHRLASGRPLLLGGVEVPFPLGLHGHSDGDVLVHAIIDALLGAAGMGDIGAHFGIDDPRYEGASSLTLLQEAWKRIAAKGYLVGNIDATIVAEAPRLSPFIGQMKANIALVLELPEERVNIKATTAEGMGPVGAGEGIAAFATAALAL